MTVCPRCGCPSFGPRCRRCTGLLPTASGASGLSGGLEGKKKAKSKSKSGSTAAWSGGRARGLPMWAKALLAFGGILLIGGGLFWLKTRKRRT